MTAEVDETALDEYLTYLYIPATQHHLPGYPATTELAPENWTIC